MSQEGNARRVKRRELPLIYACSGCSSVAQLANDVAVHLDHQSKAEMSCISGVGGGVEALVKVARSGRDIIAIDGCQLHSTEACLAKCGVQPAEHVKLYEYGHKKRIGEKASDADFGAVVAHVEQLLVEMTVKSDRNASEQLDFDGDSRWDTQKRTRFFSRSTLRY